MHILRGLLLTACLIPFLPERRQAHIRQHWSRQMLAVLGIHLDVNEPYLHPGSLLVANHVSWVDVFVINACSPVAFVAKADIRDWPVFGWLARHHGTVFIRRESRRHARAIYQEIGLLLEAGKHVALFPEGTTTDGQTLGTFHGALLQAAVETGAPVQPLAVSYRTPAGQLTTAPAYAGDTTLLESLRAILAEPRLIARVRIQPALSPRDYADRKQLTEATRAAVAAGLA